MLAKYGIILGEIIVYCDNTSAINISKNPVQHSRTKHIDIRHHFVNDLVEFKIIVLEFVEIDKQFANIFAKPLDFAKFDSLRKFLGICSF